MSGNLYVFVDTNVFIQCKSLEELTWDAWKDYDEIVLIVSRPVQAEIDFQKDRGNGRVRKRARVASRIFREILASASREKIIRPDNPKVRLVLRQDIKPAADLADRLSYEARDDQLVGIACHFASTNPTADVRILTHDTGPMCSADMVGLKFVEIPEDWLLPPEGDEADKRVASLTAELVRLKKEEPEFTITFRNSAGEEVSALEGTVPFYQPLMDYQVDDLMEQLTQRLPVVTSFATGSESPNDPLNAILRGALQVSRDQIRDYKTKYSKWLKEAKERVEISNALLNLAAREYGFAFVISNVGVRPGNHGHVTIKASGDFLVGIEPEKPEDLEIVRAAPRPPRPMWYGMGGDFLNINRYIGAAVPPISRKDPTRFYYVDKQKDAVREFSLTCERWPHGVEAEEFYGAIRLPMFLTEVKGLLKCEVRAANLSDVASLGVPVRLKVEVCDTYKKISDLIATFPLE
jgi:hypothetical protein